jgi:hypothetical protein
MPSVVCDECHSHYAECHYAECHHAECHYAECRYAESRGTDPTFCRHLLVTFKPIKWTDRHSFVVKQLELLPIL